MKPAERIYIFDPSLIYIRASGGKYSEYNTLQYNFEVLPFSATAILHFLLHLIYLTTLTASYFADLV